MASVPRPKYLDEPKFATTATPKTVSSVPKPQSVNTMTSSIPMPKYTSVPSPKPPAPVSPVAPSQIKSYSSVPMPKSATAMPGAGSSIAVGVPSPSGPTTPQKSPGATPVPMPNNYTPSPGTNYVAKGNQELNDILYNKRTYESNPNNTGLQNWASTTAKDIYTKLDPTTAQMVQGMNADQLEAYINSLGGGRTGVESAVEAPVGDPGAFVPPSPSNPIPMLDAPTIPVMDMDAINRYVEGQLSAELLRQRSSADQAINAGKLTTEQQTAALRQAAERLRGDITEQRGIENVEAARRLNPFNGRSDFERGMLVRERGRQDERLNENQQMQEANIQANLAQLENEINAKYATLQQTQGAERERMIQEIRNDERNYELMLRGEFRSDALANSQINNTNFNQSLGQWQANRGAYEFDKNFGLQEGQLTGNYRGTPTLAAQNQQFNQNMATQQFQYQQARDAIADQQYKQQFDEDVRRFGLNYALQQAQMNNQISSDAANRSLRQAELNLSRDRFEAEQTPTGPEPLSTSQLSGIISMVNNSQLTSNEQKAAFVNSLGLSDADKQRVYQLLGLPIFGPPAPTGGTTTPTISDEDILQYLR